MQLTVRQQHWLGAIGSILAQSALFFALWPLIGDLPIAVLMLLINIGLAASYRSSNPYLTGARWASFLTLSYASYVRHSYWYPYVLESFMRLRDFSNPVGLTEVLHPGSTHDAVVTGVTGGLIILFYSYIMRWPEWTGRWEMLRRAPFSASLGLQAIFTVTVIYPTVLSMVLVLFFASIVSPLLRRQVRLNHIVFLTLPPLFSLGNETVALVASFIAGYIFLYFVSFERSLTHRSASFAFFTGVVFLALSVSLIENYVVLNFRGLPAGIAATISFVFILAMSYVLIYRGEAAISLVRRLQMRWTPRRWSSSPWWSVRDHWVDREVDTRVHKRYKWKEQEKNLALFVFGPREWAPGSENYQRVTAPSINMAAAAIVLAFYSIWLLVDAALILLVGYFPFLITAVLIGFVFILAVPCLLFWKELRRGSEKHMLTVFGTGVSALLFGGFMVIVVYLGLMSGPDTPIAPEGAEVAVTQAE